MPKKAAPSLVTLKNIRPTSAPFDTSESKGATGLWVPVQVEYTSLRGLRKAYHASFMAPTSVNWDYAPALDAIAPGWTKDTDLFQRGLRQLRMDRTFFFSVVRYDKKEGTIHSAIVNPDWRPPAPRRTLAGHRRPVVTWI